MVLPGDVPEEGKKTRLKRKLPEKQGRAYAEPRMVGKCGLALMRKAMMEICGGDIVEEIHEERHREIYCQKCGVMYNTAVFTNRT